MRIEDIEVSLATFVVGGSAVASLAILFVALAEPPRRAPDVRISSGPPRYRPEELARVKQARKYAERAEEAVRANDLAAAERWYEKALSLNPSDPPSRLELAKIYDRTGRKKRADDAYVKALRPTGTTPGFPTNDLVAITRYGDVMARRGDTRAAYHAYDVAAGGGMSDVHVLARDGSFASARGAAYATVGILAYKARDYAEAERRLRASVAADGGSWIALSHLAQTLRVTGRTRQAAIVAARADRRYVSDSGRKPGAGRSASGPGENKVKRLDAS